jgi:hypothetical protein
MPNVAGNKIEKARKMRKILIINFLLIAVLPCLAQKYNAIIFDSINRNTLAKELFLKNIIAKDLITYEDKNVKYNAITAFEKFKQTADATQIDIKNGQKKIIGKIYAVEKFVPSDTIFKYENLSFNRFLIFSDIKNKTIAFKLYNDVQNEYELNKLTEKYIAKNKEISGSNEAAKNDYTFTLDDRTIILKRLNQNESSPAMMVEPSPVSEKESEKSNSTSSISIELIVIFNNLSFELKKYLEDYIYSL